MEKEKQKLELANQQFEETVGLAMDRKYNRKLKNYVLEEDKQEAPVKLKTKSVDKNSLLDLNIVLNGDS